MTLAQKNKRAKLLAAAAKQLAATSAAQRGSPSTRARRAPSRLMQAAFDKGTRRNVGQVHRAPVSLPKGLDKKHHFNAFGIQKPQALAFSVGPATHISGAKRFPLAISSDRKYTLVAFQPGSGYYQLVAFYSDGTGTWLQDQVQTITSTGITPNVATASSPDSIMCSRGSMRVRNITAAGDVAGAIHFYRCSTGLANFWTTPATCEEVKNMILESNDTVTMSGSQLTETHQWDCIPVSQDKYHAFTKPDADLEKYWDPGLSTVLMLFEHDQEHHQSYEISIAATYYARYRITGPLANSAQPPPVASLGYINRMRDLAEAIGSFGTPFLRTATSAAFNGARQALPGLLGNLVRQNLPLALTTA